MSVNAKCMFVGPSLCITVICKTWPPNVYAYFYQDLHACCVSEPETVGSNVHV